VAEEGQRAEALDRLCAELDMQIGLTVRKLPPGTIAGTRLRGVAEAAGFRLSPTGRFEWVQDDTGAVLFTLQNVTDEAFTADSLRVGATAGVVFLLDVPRVADPPRAFDQMKLAAKRMAHTLGGEVVDDNGRLLNDAGLAAIREQVASADAALRRYNIEPGSPRALKLFAA
jgi:FtsZ-interacting cell division protein ZipA